MFNTNHEKFYEKMIKMSLLYEQADKLSKIKVFESEEEQKEHDLRVSELDSEAEDLMLELMKMFMKIVVNLDIKADEILRRLS